MRDCLENVPISSDVPNSPLPQTSTAEPENVTANTDEQNLLHTVIWGKARPRPKSKGPSITDSTMTPEQKKETHKLKWPESIIKS